MYTIEACGSDEFNRFKKTNLNLFLFYLECYVESYLILKYRSKVSLPCLAWPGRLARFINGLHLDLDGFKWISIKYAF